MVRVLGLRSYRDRICWAVVDGGSRTAASIADHGTLQIPPGARGAGLAWVRQEMHSLVEKEQPDLAALSPAEGASANNALIERAQVDGVVLEILQSLGVEAEAKKTATVRSGFKAKNSTQFEAALAVVPVIAAIPKTAARREPVIVAASSLP